MLRTWLYSTLLIALACLSPAGARAQSIPNPQTPRQGSSMARACPDDMDPSQQQALKDDLQKMRAILDQMRANLSFVGNNTSPLNHQFQLEIEMWQMLVDRVARHIQSPLGDARR